MSFTRPTPAMRLVVTGITGTGKSYRVKDALREWLSLGVRVVAVDVCDEYSRHGKAKHDLVNLGPLRKRVTAHELAANPGLLNDSRLSLSVVPTTRSGEHDKSPAGWARTFLLVEKIARYAGKLVLVVDETGTWTNPANGPACAQARAALEALSTNGRKDGIALVVVAQRQAQIATNVRSQASEMWVFGQSEPADVDALAERFGREEAERIAKLPPYEFAEWRRDGASPAQKTRALRPVPTPTPTEKVS